MGFESWREPGRGEMVPRAHSSLDGAAGPDQFQESEWDLESEEGISVQLNPCGTWFQAQPLEEGA